MKINRDNPASVDNKSADAAAEAGSSDDAFKQLLDDKQRPDGARPNGDRAEKDAKKDVKKDKASKKAAANKRRHPKKGGKHRGYGRKIQAGDVQRHRQADRQNRLAGQRKTTRHHKDVDHDQRRAGHRHHRRHQQVARRDQAGRSAGSAGGQGRADTADPTGSTSGRPGGGEVAVDVGQAERADGPAGGPETAGAAKADGGGRTERSARHQEIAKLAGQLVDKAQIGQDAAGRQVMLLDLEVPGRGQVHVRLRRRGESFEVRMRPENKDLGRDLRHERHNFRQAAADKGVSFSSIEIV